LKLAKRFPGTTSGGKLPCKKIMFIPWSPNSRDVADVKKSLSLFMENAFDYARAEGYKSIG
jgi:hypothetical protein